VGFLELLGAAGTFASILGIFFAIYAKQNGRLTRAFISQENEKTRRSLAKMDKTMGKMDKTLNKIAELIVSEGKRTRKAFRSGKQTSKRRKKK